MPNLLLSLKRSEILTLLFLGSLVLFGLALPAFPQSEQYHHFANQLEWWGIPNFADVASNIIFAVTGLLGLVKLRHVGGNLQIAKFPLALFFLGLLLTSAGSAYYHWNPTSAALVWDRVPMVMAFSGIIGTFVTLRVSPRIGYVSVIFCLVIGLMGLFLPGHLTLYAALQFGGLHGLLVGAIFFDRKNDPFPWFTLLGWYVFAKVLEHVDAAVWVATHQIVSGHTLKHLAAGMAGVLILKHLSITPKK